jgi:anaerobic selenocysteine-containing dehydrogenase
VEDGKLIAVEPDPAHPTGAALCIKGKAAPELVNSDERLLYPLRRTDAKDASNPGWERVSWEEALEWTATKMRDAARGSDLRRDCMD